MHNLNLTRNIAIVAIVASQLLSLLLLQGEPVKVNYNYTMNKDGTMYYVFCIIQCIISYQKRLAALDSCFGLV